MPGTVVPLAVEVIPLPDQQWSGDIAELAALLAEHLVAVLPDGTPKGPLVGQVNGSEPNTDQGLWLNNNVWYKWSTQAGKYLPFPLVAGGLVDGTLRKTVLKPTGQGSDIILYLPDQDGATLATEDDIERITGLRPTQTIQDGGSVTLDFDSASRFVINISADMSLAYSGGVDGQSIDIWFITPANTSPAFALTWTGFYGVSSGALPTTDATHFAVTRVKVYVVGEKTFVEFGDTWQVLVADDTTLPKFVTAAVDIGSAVILVTSDKLLKAGNSLDVSKFYVTRNGVQNPVTAAAASGKLVKLSVANSYQLGDNGFVSYNGTDVMDVSGNLMAPFTPRSVSVNKSKVPPITLAP